MAEAEPEKEPETESEGEEWDEDPLLWSFQYVAVCIFLPMMNGVLNGYSWSGVTLHYAEMGWPIVRSGIPCTVGFGTRLIFQQVQLYCGFWAAVPLQTLHVACCVIGIFYGTEEWAVILEIAALMAFEAGVVIEGLSFDVFGLSESLARQASSTVLAVFTISCAVGVTIGGVIYDLAGWQGMSVFHTACAAILLLLFIAQPSCRLSFWEFFFWKQDDDFEVDDRDIDGVDVSNELNTFVVPGDTGVGKTVLPHEVQDLDVENLDAESCTARETLGPRVTETGQLGELHRHDGRSHKSQASNRGTLASRGSQLSAGDRAGLEPHFRGSNKSQQSSASMQVGSNRPARQSTVSRFTILTSATNATPKSKRSGRTENTQQTGRRSAWTVGTAESTGTANTARTVLSRITSLSNLKDSDNYQHHFFAHAALRPTIAERAGIQDDDDDDDDHDLDENEEEVPKAKGIPKDVRVPAACIMLCCFNNVCCYALEFGTFAIFFKQYHGWEDATWASLAQTAGDLLAAVMMKILGSGLMEPEEDMSCWRRSWMQPYNLSWLLFGWILCNSGMTCPWLPIAVAAQVVMGTVYVYVSKATTDLNLFYSMGDTGVFLSMQVYGKNLEALGGCLASFLGTFLYAEAGPFAPFIFSTSVSIVTFIVFTTCFCKRVGMKGDIEAAEAKRSRKLGTQRVSTWSVDVRKSNVVAPDA